MNINNNHNNANSYNLNRMKSNGPQWSKGTNNQGQNHIPGFEVPIVDLNLNGVQKSGHKEQTGTPNQEGPIIDEGKVLGTTVKTSGYDKTEKTQSQNQEKSFLESTWEWVKGWF